MDTSTKKVQTKLDLGRLIEEATVDAYGEEEEATGF